MANLKDSIVDGSLVVTKDIQFYYEKALKNILNIFEPHVWNITHRYDYSNNSWGKRETIHGTYFTMIDGSIIAFYRKPIAAFTKVDVRDNYSYPVKVNDKTKPLVFCMMTAAFDANNTEVEDNFYTNVTFIVRDQTEDSFTIRGYRDTTSSLFLGYTIMVFIPASAIA